MVSRDGHRARDTSLVVNLTPNESPPVVDQERIPQLNSDTLMPSNQVLATRNTNSVTVKARYRKETIKFRLSWPWETVELKQQVERRLELKDGTYFIRYKDEANEMILIACDEDLQDCISSSSPHGINLIEVFLEPK
ncbi:hypothetical protein RHMOL_Rhmol02G0041300 [Rhododendron molle]|uniref:Uncharacterized protein n=1 Tax=Rhododendron molle TaxID=49168 RepID=A0ACC0PL50_RHOML|nr:hypothetical protein RHMOL_Rhmol02G0041300 [Rhododendron molle]